MKRTCPKCKKRNRKIIAPSPFYFDEACADCGYVFKEDRMDRLKNFYENLQWILKH